jgi:hydroxyacylglutathione hydrolase
MKLGSSDAAGDAQSAVQVVLIETSQERMKNNNYIVVDVASRQAVLVDPAWEMDKIEGELERLRVRLSGILVTHSHADHIHLARPIAERQSCPIWMSRREVDYSGFEAPQLVAIDQSSWRVGSMTIHPILTPGHTPGCICYLIEGNVFTGDVLFAEGCGNCRDRGAAHAMFESLQRLRERLTPDTRVFPGHTYIRPAGLKFAEVQRVNMYMQFQDRESFANYRLRNVRNKRKWLF